MELIEKDYLEKLRDSGLFVSSPLETFNGGVWVVKPSSTKGHHIPEYNSSYVALDGELSPPDSNAPMIAFYKQDSKWVVNGKRTTGKNMAPGDFINEWETPDEAIKDILDFYFGDSSRMIVKAFEHGKFHGRSEALEENKT